MLPVPDEYPMKSDPTGVDMRALFSLLVCFYLLKIIFYFKLLFFLIFFYYFNTRILKIIFKK